MSAVQTSLDSVHAVLTAKFGVPGGEIVHDASLESLGLDSLSLVELALILQEELGVEVGEHETAGGTTVGELARVLAAKCAATAGSVTAASVAAASAAVAR